MNQLLNRVVRRLRVTTFPTEQDREYRRWRADHPDEGARYEYDLGSGSLVLDLGGYKGQWASDIFARYGCRVMVFEPVASFAARIRDRFKLNSRIEVFDIALGASRRPETIALSEDGSSTYGESAAKETIAFEDVVAFFETHGVEAVDLIKLNIEGGEYELLPRLFETGLIARIKELQIQFHDVSDDSETRLRQIRSELQKTHRPTYQYKFVWENWVRRDS